MHTDVVGPKATWSNMDECFYILYMSYEGKIEPGLFLLFSIDYIIYFSWSLVLPPFFIIFVILNILARYNSKKLCTVGHWFLVAPNAVCITALCLFY